MNMRMIRRRRTLLIVMPKNLFVHISLVLKVFIWHSNNNPMLALRVDRRKAEEIRQELFRLRLLDGSRKFKADEDYVEIPVIGLEGISLGKWDAIAVEQEEPVKRPEVYDPFKEIVRSL